jgi:predicted  nucleic acid-binding Zn-ribbon protein
MIKAILLIALGFLIATLIGVLIAPSLWNRAYRLSRKRLEQTLPVSLSEIEAAQDQLKASYAVRMRRLETALASAKQKAAAQLVDNSRLQMQIVTLKDQITDLDLNLSERQNATTVLEQTITKRFPELDREISAVKQQLQERSYELEDLRNKLARRSEELEGAGTAAASYQAELARLREALEKNSADRTGRRLRRASQWSLEDYRAEYDRLNLELSKLRQQLAQLQDKDALQAAIIKEELQKLAELILVSSQPKSQNRTSDRADGVSKRPGPEPRRDRPVPWPESSPAEASTLPGTLAKAGSSGGEQSSAPASAPETPAGAYSASLPAEALGASPEAGSTLEDGTKDGLLPETSAAPRSVLLRDAIPEKPFKPAAGPNGASEPAQPKNGLVADDEAKDARPQDLSPTKDGHSVPEPAGGRTLLERLQGASEETAEADK